MRYLSLFVFVIISVSCSTHDNPHYKTATNFVLLNEALSPNEDFRYYEYQFDTGAFGYSRVFWAIVNADAKNQDLSKTLIPDGYKIIGWSENSELILQEWEPYYYKSEDIKLSDGMELLGVKIKVLNKDVSL